MSFKFDCPKCTQRLEADDEYIGKEVNCPACNNTFIVEKNPEKENEKLHSSSGIDENQKELLFLRNYIQEYKKKAAEDLNECKQKTMIETIQLFLPMFDMLWLAKGNAAAIDDPALLKQGYSVLFEQFNSIFQELKITPIEAIGLDFDGSRHECTERRITEGISQNKVIEQSACGFIWREKILRKARVVIGE